MEKIAVIDFDGTITTKDVTDEILSAFSVSYWQNIGQSHDNGLLSHHDMNERFVSSLRATREELAAFIRNQISITEGFADFLDACPSLAIKPIILSGGWDLYIQEALNQISLDFIQNLENLSDITRQKIDVICNKIRLNGDDRWAIDFPFPDTSYFSCPDKRTIVLNLRSQYPSAQIVAIGDGSTDIEMAQVADKVFAKNRLEKSCRSRKIKYERFRNFHDILGHLA